MSAWKMLATAAFMLTLTSACSSTSEHTTVVCAAGDHAECTGVDGCRGTRDCEAGSWTACECGSSAGNSGGGNGGTSNANGGSSTGSGGAATSGSSGGGLTGNAGTAGGGTTGGNTGASGGGTSTGDGSGGATGDGSGGTGDGSGGTGGALCSAGEARCGQAGRERCDGSQWVSEPCPLDTPACSDGECILRGPAMVRVDTYYIDSTEVTSAQYQEFLTAKNGDTSGQPDYCSENTSYWDNANALNPDAWPITWVDWCDARAFCDWAGKRLCGHREGGPIAADDFFDQGKSEWILACGGPSAASHPNQQGECNASGGLADVASYECEGYYPGIFDLEGNAAEWVDSCDSWEGMDDVCHLAGGSYVNQAFCDNVLADYPRNRLADPFGFRCCNG